MAENGILDYQGMNQAIYRGATSNIVVDTQSMSIEIGAGNTSHTSNLHFECNHDANVASIKLNSNVVTEFPRSKKLIKYPRVALTQNALNNGYAAEASSQENANRHAWKVFNNTYAEGDGWRSAQSYASDGSFTGTFVDFSNGGQTFIADDKGEWLKITLPEKMRLERFRLQPRYSPTTGGATYSYGRSEFVKNGAIWGSNDGSSWDKVYTITYGVPATDTTITEFTVSNSTTAYNNFVLVVTDTHGSSAGLRTSFSEWELLGVPEYDPEAHGTNVTIKSKANVPNTDWLEVYYDAKNYTSGVVQDETGNNRHGTLDGVTYDSVSESFTFVSGNKITAGPMTSFPSGTNYTASMWFKVSEIVTSQKLLFHFGHGSTGESFGLNIQNGNVGQYLWGGSTKFTADNLYTANEWVHAVGTINGSTAEVYVNGHLRLSWAQDITTTIPTNPYLSLGIHFTGEQSSFYTSGFFTGSIANFRIFNRVLTQDEVWQLYAYQKEDFGHSTNNLTLKAGRLGIGTSEPRGVLDVRGDMYGGCPVFFTAYAGNNGTVTGSSAGTVIVFNTTTVNKGGAYDTSNGKCTFPISGYYEVFFRGGTAGTADFHAKIYRNGNAPGSGGWPNHVSRLWDAADSTYRNAGTIQFFDYFEAGEYIEVRLTNFSVFNADNYNSFSVKYLSN